MKKKIFTLSSLVLVGLLFFQLGDLGAKDNDKKEEKKSEKPKNSITELKTFGVQVVKDSEVKTIEHMGAIKIYDSNVTTAKIKGPVKTKNSSFKKELEVYGPLSAKGGNFVKIKVYGPCRIDNATVKSLDVEGPLRVEESKVTGKIEVTGPLRGDESTFEQDITVKGPFKADECHIKGSIILTANVTEYSFAGKKKKNWTKPVMVLDETTVDGTITVKGDVEGDNHHVIILKDGCKIKKIIFESKKGLVISDSKSSIKDGIEGGELKDRKKHRKLDKKKDGKKK